MGSQRFCLRWNNHQSNLLSVFDQLLHDEAFVDVTLAVEGQFLKAHKMVLSACSPYFQALFVGHPDKHPIVILKDVPFTDMRSLLDFMYRGEVSVDQDRLTAFLKVAESLRIKGLTEVNDERCDLPSIANSLLNSSLPPPPPPPPPNLHRIPLQGMQQSMVHQSPNSPHHMGSQQLHSGKRPHLQQHHHQIFANSLMNSGLHGPKRKRGRPRKLSGSSPGRPEMEHEDSLMNNVDNHLGVAMGEHLVVKAVAPGTALSKQLTIVNPHLSSPHHSNTERCSPHPLLAPGDQGVIGSPAVTPRRTESSEPASPANATAATDIDDVEEEAVDEDEDGEAGNHGSPEPEHENETDEYNNQLFKSEGDPKPSTSGQENSSPYRQHNQPTTHQSNSSDPAHQFPSAAGMDRHVRMPLCKNEIDIDSDDEDEKSLIVDGIDETGDADNNNESSSLETGNESEAKHPDQHMASGHGNEFTEPSRPAPQRRRVRRRAASGTDPAEALTEMSVRGLNLFRYASISEGIYQCMECAKTDVTKTFKNKYSFQRHAFLYHEGQQRKVFPCPVCSKEFSRPDKMKNHMKMVHDCFMPKEVMFPSVGYYLPP